MKFRKNGFRSISLTSKKRHPCGRPLRVAFSGFPSAAQKQCALILQTRPFAFCMSHNSGSIGSRKHFSEFQNYPSDETRFGLKPRHPVPCIRFDSAGSIPPFAPPKDGIFTPTGKSSGRQNCNKTDTVYSLYTFAISRHSHSYSALVAASGERRLFASSYCRHRAA